MRTILIDPAKRTVEEIDTDGSLETLRQILGGHNEGVEIAAQHYCFYATEEGPSGQPRDFFQFTEGPSQPLAGRGIILAVDGSDVAACTLPVDWVRDNVTFMDLHEALAAHDDPMFHAAVSATRYPEPENEPAGGPDEPDLG